MNQRYKVRDNGDGSFAVTRGEVAVVETSDPVFAQMVRNGMNFALDNETYPINQQDEE